MVADKTNGDSVFVVRANIFLSGIRSRVVLFSPEKRDMFLQNILSLGGYSLLSTPILNGLANYYASIIGNTQSRMLNYSMRGLFVTNISLYLIMIGGVSPVWRSLTQGCNDSVIMRSAVDTIFFTPIMYYFSRKRQTVQLKELANNGSQFKELQSRIIHQDGVSKFLISRYYGGIGWQMLQYCLMFSIVIDGSKYIRSGYETWLGVQGDTPLTNSINIITVSMLSGMVSAPMAWCSSYHVIHAHKGWNGYKETAKALYDNLLCSKNRPLLCKAIGVRILMCAVMTTPLVAHGIHPIGDKIMKEIEQLVKQYHAEYACGKATERVLEDDGDQYHSLFCNYL